MSKTVLMLFAACVGLSLLSLHLVKQIRTADATIVDLQQQLATHKELAQSASTVQPVEEPPVVAAVQEKVEAPAPVKEEPLKNALSKVVPVPEGEPVGIPNREERMRMMREARERQRQLMQDPEYREAMLLQNRSNMTRQYPGLAQDMGFSAEQTEAFFNLLAEHQMRTNEQLEPMWDLGGDPATMQQNQRKAQEKMVELQRKNEAEIAAHLGPEKLQAWKEYQSTIGVRHQAEQLRASLSSQGIPLSEDASRSVVKAMAEAQKAEMQEYANMARESRGFAGVVVAKGSSNNFHSAMSSPEGIERALEATKRRNQRLLEAMSPYLTYEQRQAIEKEQEAQVKVQEAHMRVMRAQGSSGSSVGFGTSSGLQPVIIPAQ
jgi:hypothetical protein